MQNRGVAISGLMLQDDAGLQAEPTARITGLQDVLQHEENTFRLWKFSAGVGMYH